MQGLLFLLLQGVIDMPAADASRFDLRNLPRRDGDGCGPGASTRPGDIIVCAPRTEEPPPDGPAYAIDPLLPRAEIGIGTARLSLDADQAELPLGQVSRRAMVRLRIPF